MGIQKFEEIQAWQEARKLTQMIYRLTRSGPISKDFGLKDQIQRASVSVMANIAEGFGADTKKEFALFLSYSRRSLLEVQSLLYTVLDSEYIDQVNFSELFRQTETALRLVSAFKISITSRNP